ncbi:hypothetical protein FDB55_01995 [Clostridium botulinum]|uniref:hypothetical protein n=1 Tax=Clostridium botulinum TaxID=1491 RepID=UPI0013F13F7A|nr:hypothetical protein [Clostridium botulinum]NFE10704.1 hypothetical protein [Clostridium botulinum]NFL42253.1 hypothetical protein [Clostridium botulinum]NFN20524.1 hypothetical protein [Clostridium botulinum]NFN41262.1 hypothetical protein [Clostridium botulinum]
MKNFKKLLSALLVFCGLAILNPVQANAAWKQNNTGWWYTQDSSYSIGWEQINGKWYYFDSNGYMKIGWIYDNGQWYYCWSNGQMACNTNIGQYYLNSSGAWIQTKQPINTNTVVNGTNTNTSDNNINKDKIVKTNEKTYIDYNSNNKTTDDQDDEDDIDNNKDDYDDSDTSIKSTSKKSKKSTSDSYDYSRKSSSEVYVHGHYRKGKYIKPHYRTKKDHTTKNNYSHKGNRNPHNGKRGYKK